MRKLLQTAFYFIYTGELGYDGPLYDGSLHMTDDMLGPSSMHIKVFVICNIMYTTDFAYDRPNFLVPLSPVISKFTCMRLVCFTVSKTFSLFWGLLLLTYLMALYGLCVPMCLKASIHSFIPHRQINSFKTGMFSAVS